MSNPPTYEIEIKTYSSRWKNLSTPIKDMASACGVQIEILAIPLGLFRFYHCVASGQRESLELFKNRWAESEKTG